VRCRHRPSSTSEVYRFSLQPGASSIEDKEAKHPVFFFYAVMMPTAAREAIFGLDPDDWFLGQSVDEPADERVIFS
jgi:hypothetical protein